MNARRSLTTRFLALVVLLMAVMGASTSPTAFAASPAL